MKITAATQRAIEKHALECYPEECVGIIVDGKYKRLKNTHANPTESGSFDESVFVKYQVQALIHSHPNSGNQPSLADCDAWRKLKVVFGIIATDGEAVSEIRWLDENNPAPLVGREFIYGHHDCGSIVRDWYWLERGIRIPDFARDHDWKPGEAHKDLYSQIVDKAGFYEVDRRDLQEGDVLLMRIAGPHMHHAAVYVGNNKILQQLHAPKARHLSGYDDLMGAWDKFVVKVVRYGKQK